MGRLSDNRFLTGPVPPGSVFPFAGTTAPSGYLLCNGSAISRTTFAALFAAIGSSHGSGDGSTTFNLPDYRGRFMRGRDGGVARDPDRAARIASASGGNTGDNVGTTQADAIQGHEHALYEGSYSIQLTQSGSNIRNTPAVATGGLVGCAPSSGTAISDLQIGSAISSTNGGAWGTVRQAAEARPTNINVNYIIKI